MTKVRILRYREKAAREDPVNGSFFCPGMPIGSGNSPVGVLRDYCGNWLHPSPRLHGFPDMLHGKGVGSFPEGDALFYG